MMREIVFGILIFQSLVFVVQWFIFQRREFWFLALFCAILAFHNGLYGSGMWFKPSSLIQNTALDFYLQRMLALLAFFTFAKFAFYFLETNARFPELKPRIRLFIRLSWVNLLIQTGIAIVQLNDFWLDKIFIAGFLMLSAIAFSIAFRIVRQNANDVLMRFIVLAGLLIVFSSLASMIGNSLAFDFPNRVFLDSGFLGGLFLLNIGLFYKLHRLQENALESRELMIRNISEKEELAYELLTVRQKISMDIHDDVMSGLGTLRIVGELIKSEEHKNNPKIVDKIAASASEISDKLRLIVWSLSDEHNTLQALWEQSVAIGSEFFKHTGIGFSYQNKIAHSATIALSGEVRKNLLLALKEALHNARKHARPERVCLRQELMADGRELLITVEDDGCGLPAETSSGGQGLRNMQRRINAVGGRLSMPKRSKGTTVCLLLPLAATAKHSQK